MPEPPRWLQDSIAGKDVRHCKPKAHEKGTAEALGGRRHDGSGRFETSKGDVSGVCAKDLDFLIECKHTVGKSLSVQAAWLQKVTLEAGFLREPALSFKFDDAVMASLGRREDLVAESEWIAVPRSVFSRMLDIICDAG